MPCLNESETLGLCIDKALSFLAENNIVGEVLIADNCSTDDSIEIAIAHGARVVRVPVRGYGAALRQGIEASLGKYVIMGDSDDSYDFSRLNLFVEQLRAGNDLVMGNRRKGGIVPGAMPLSHKYLGNPLLSFIGRLFFNIPGGDFHCGLRGFNRKSILELGLTTSGMEFASEMVVRSALAHLKIVEVPTTLSPDGRSRPPHLNTWRDGWRHLRFLLLFSPRWLFFYPSLCVLILGLFLTLLLSKGAVSITPEITLDIHSFIIGCFAALVGLQGVSFAIIARRYAAQRGFVPIADHTKSLLDMWTLERVLIIAGLLLLGGLYGFYFCIKSWFTTSFGPLEYASLVRVLLVSGTAITAGIQLAFTGFLSEILEIKTLNIEAKEVLVESFKMETRPTDKSKLR